MYLYYFTSTFIFRSRLGCQIILSKDLEGLKVNVPSEVKDVREVPRIVNS